VTNVSVYEVKKRIRSIPNHTVFFMLFSNVSNGKQKSMNVIIIGIYPISIAGRLLPHLVFKVSVSDASGTSAIPSTTFAINTNTLNRAVATIVLFAYVQFSMFFKKPAVLMASIR